MFIQFVSPSIITSLDIWIYGFCNIFACHNIKNIFVLFHRSFSPQNYRTHATYIFTFVRVMIFKVIYFIGISKYNFILELSNNNFHLWDKLMSQVNTRLIIDFSLARILDREYILDDLSIWFLDLLGCFELWIFIMINDLLQMPTKCDLCVYFFKP